MKRVTCYIKRRKLCYLVIGNPGNSRRFLYTIGVVVCVLLVIALMNRNDSEPQKIQEISEETVVVSAHSDPYFSLAQRISQEENLRIFEKFSDVLPFLPKFVILVSAPNNLTMGKLSGIADTFKKQAYYPALGIISGSTLDIAEKLWERRNAARPGNNFVGGDAEMYQSIYEPALFNISDGNKSKIDLNENSLIETLKQADYIYWTRHTGARSWFWNKDSENWGKNDELSPEEIPQLKPVVIYSPTCNIFRPWRKDSMALAFIDKGAAAFLGPVNSPHSDTFSKYGLLVPGLTSWKEFPLGLITQVQNKTTTGLIYNSPQFFMLGDPRIHLSKNQPYQILSDQIDETGKRVIVGHSDRHAILSVKIDNAADYNFLSIKGLTSLSEDDAFYNNKAQTLNLGADKYLLFLHHGGNFQIELSSTPPFGRVVTGALIDALDYSWVAFWTGPHTYQSNSYIYIASIPILIGILLFKTFKRNKVFKDYQKIFKIALLLALFRLSYYLLRLNEYTASTNLLDPGIAEAAIGFAGVFSSVAGGLILIRDSKKILVKSLGLLFAVAHQSWMVVFILGLLTLFNKVPRLAHMTVADIWTYNILWLVLIPLLAEIIIILSANRYLTSASRYS